MLRTFACLAIGQVIVLLGAAAVGLVWPGDMANRHILLAVFALLLSCLIQVVVFTYLTVTGKVIIQAVHLGSLSAEPIEEARRLKRSVTRLIGLIVSAIVWVTGTGAQFWRTGNSAGFLDGGLHALAAALAVAVHLYVFYRDFTLIAENVAVLECTLGAYSRRRKVKGSARQRGAAGVA